MISLCTAADPVSGSRPGAAVAGAGRDMTDGSGVAVAVPAPHPSTATTVIPTRHPKDTAEYRAGARPAEARAEIRLGIRHAPATA